jgi:hypothetical protein
MCAQADGTCTVLSKRSTEQSTSYVYVNTCNSMHMCEIDALPGVNDAVCLGQYVLNQTWITNTGDTCHCLPPGPLVRACAIVCVLV